MSESAESVAASLKSSRSITVEITNYTNNCCLIDPKVFLESGQVYSPPQPTVRPQKTELCNFTSVSGKASGAVGVMTYDLFRRGGSASTERMAIMFSVPRDYNFYKNWLALGIYTMDKECNNALYEEMYNNKEQVGFLRCEGNGCGLVLEGRTVDLMATMSPTRNAVMKVELWDKSFHQQMSQLPY